MVEEVVALEDGVLLHHPVVVLRHERAEDGGGDVGVVVGAERVADVVEQGAGDVLLVLAGPMGPGGGLEGVREPVDGEAPEVAVEQAEVSKDRSARPWPCSTKLFPMIAQSSAVDSSIPVNVARSPVSM